MRAVIEELERNVVNAELLALKRRERELSNLSARLGDPAGSQLDELVVEWQNKILAERRSLRERIARLRATDNATEVRHGHR